MDTEGKEICSRYKLRTLKMRTIALHILDIVENSIEAHAKIVQVEIHLNSNDIYVSIEDDGVGMDDEEIKNAIIPSYSTKSLNRGMGIPLFKEIVEKTGGTFSISSKKGEGTKIEGVFIQGSKESIPLGNIGESFITLLSSNMETEYKLVVYGQKEKFDFDTRELKKELNGASIQDPKVVLFVRNMIEENISEIGGSKK